MVFASTPGFCKSQTRLDTINNLTKYSMDYFQILFNDQNVDKAAAFWTDVVIEDLKAGYNNGRIPYKTKEDVKKLFSKDLKKLLKDLRQPMTFIPHEETILFEEDGYMLFLKTFDISTNLILDKDLLNTSLQVVSDDKGKTWKVNVDDWINAFMYYLYRRTTR